MCPGYVEFFRVFQGFVDCGLWVLARLQGLGNLSTIMHLVLHSKHAIAYI